MRRAIFLVLATLAIVFGSSRSFAAQGVAVVGMTGARDEAFALARDVYASPLRPRKLGEPGARVLGGDPAPPPAAKDVKDLAELRAAVTSEDAASRQILSGIAKQIDVQGILVVSKVVSAVGTPTPDDADGGTPIVANPGTRVQARLFIVEQGDFDAARYEYDGSWKATVTSISARFPQVQAPSSIPAPPATVVVGSAFPRTPEKKEDRPFYKSPWLWGSLAAALLIGGVFFFASQDNSGDPIHVRMNVPR